MHLINVLLCLLPLGAVHAVVLFVLETDNIVENLLVGDLFKSLIGAVIVVLVAEDIGVIQYQFLIASYLDPVEHFVHVFL